MGCDVAIHHKLILKECCNIENIFRNKSLERKLNIRRLAREFYSSFEVFEICHLIGNNKSKYFAKYNIFYDRRHLVQDWSTYINVMKSFSQKKRTKSRKHKLFCFTVEPLLSTIPTKRFMSHMRE